MSALCFVSSSFLNVSNQQIKASPKQTFKSSRRSLGTSKSLKLRCSCSENKETFSRRQFLITSLGLASSALLLYSQNAFASRDYPGVGYLGGGDKVDINNANIRAYTKFPGFYPKLASLIVKNGPYKSVEDLYNIKGLTAEQKELIKKYEDRFVALDPAPEYVSFEFQRFLFLHNILHLGSGQVQQWTISLKKNAVVCDWGVSSLTQSPIL